MNHRVVNSELPLCALIGSSPIESDTARDDIGSSNLANREPHVSPVSHPRASAPQRPSPPASSSGLQRGMGLLSRAGTLLGTVGVALLPKCPACWSVYAGLSGWLGLSIALDRALLLPLTLVCLVLTLLVLASGARRSGRYQPLACAVLAAVGVYLGKFSLESSLLAHVSLCVLVLAALAGRRAERCSKLAEHAQAR